MNKSLAKILEISKKIGYFEVEFSANKINNINALSLGSLLRENLTNHWFKSEKKINIFPHDNLYDYKNEDTFTLLDTHYNSVEFRKNLLYLKTFQKVKEIPFGINEKISMTSYNEAIVNESNFNFNLTHKNLFGCTYFINDTNRNEVFYRMQHSKKIWWMKYSANPERIFLSDQLSKKNTNGKIETVSIKMQFDFGEIELEKIQSFPLNMFVQMHNIPDYTLVSDKTEVIPSIIRSEICSDISSLGILIDSIVSSDTESILLNRKLTPYYCSVLSIKDDQTNINDQMDLVKYITLLLKNKEISVLESDNVQMCTKDDLDETFFQLDRTGVYYTIIVDPKSTENGLLKLRNRDTTLSETVHITDIPNYMVKLLNF